MTTSFLRFVSKKSKNIDFCQHRHKTVAVNEDENREIWRRIDLLCSRNDTNCSELSTWLGYSRSYISVMWKRGGNLQAEDAIKISRKFNVSLDYIYMGTETTFKDLMKTRPAIGMIMNAVVELPPEKVAALLTLLT